MGDDVYRDYFEDVRQHMQGNTLEAQLLKSSVGRAGRNSGHSRGEVRGQFGGEVVGQLPRGLVTWRLDFLEIAVRRPRPHRHHTSYLPEHPAKPAFA